MIETPEDPNIPPPTDEEIKESVGASLFWNGWLLALALTVVGFGEATGKIHFF